MFACSRCLVGTLLILLVWTAQPARGSEIRMKDGMVYSGVTIVGRDATSLKVRTAYGEVPLPLAKVASIDGARLAALPAPTAPPAAAKAPATPAAATAAPSAAAPEATPAGTPSPVAIPAQPALPDSPPPDETQPNSHLSITIAVLLLILGYGLYRLTRKFGRLALPAWLRRPSHPTAGSAQQGGFEFLDENYQAIEINVGAEATGIENAKDILKDALLDRASDVHIEPAAAEYRIRFRIDGFMHPRMKFATTEGVRLVAAIKSLAQIDIAERRKAQDGRFAGRSGGREVDFRVATTPSVFGEKLVLRILDHKAGLRGLEDLGMSQQMMERFAQVIHSRNGMILAAGPTGSGKTSTLYAALSQLDAERLNLVTIEDPVEYQLDGATQIPVNVRAGITYESGLRSILRQDPDVILVGEMRDLEAAKIAFRSALTGHLVFSSLHSRDAIGTVTRLEEMGIERHLLASAMFVVLAQRLVRVLCPHCRQAYASAGNELVEIGIELDAGQTIYRAASCRRCAGSGYIGRTGVFEMLIFDEELRQAVNDGMAENDFTKLAHAKGYREYREDAAQKVLLGITSIDEVLQAI